MNTSITTFNFRGFDLRCTMIDDQPWFNVADICGVLDIKNARHALTNVASNDVSRFKFTAGRARPHNVVNEAGLYKLIFQSRKPEARQFQDWVFGEVLPAIRKDGGYIAGEEKVRTGEMSEDELVLKAMDVMRRKIDRLAAERDALHEELYMVTVAEYCALNHVYFSSQQKAKLSLRARKLTLGAGEEVVKSARMLTVNGKLIETAVNVYRRDVLDRAAKELDLFGTVKSTVRPLAAVH